MGGEAKNPERDVPIAVNTSLLVPRAFCYLFEYFAANYFLNSGYTMQNAAGSAAPIGDGTMLSCGNTGVRVPYGTFLPYGLSCVI